MRHQKHRASMGVTEPHRRAMLSNLGSSLIRHGRIQTTLAKAKALRPWIEKIFTKAKKAGAIPRVEKNGKQVLAPRALHLRRLAHTDLRDEDMLTKLFNETYKEFEKRPGGYTRIYKLGARLGDSAEMALIEIIKAEDPGYEKRKRRAAKAKKPKAAKADAPAPAAAPAAAEGEAKA
jgi:large subunit ribosomal protein L17